jgi:hypothetical protein
MKQVVRHSYKDGEISETRTLGFSPFHYSELNLSLVIGTIRKNLSPDLLTPKYRQENLTNPTYGHCYHSTQSVFYLMDTDCLVPMSGIDYRGDSHWWLQHGENIYDVTAEQYYIVGKLPPYQVGKKTQWYGWKQRPHQRSLNLMMKVLGSLNINYTYKIYKIS